MGAKPWGVGRAEGGDRGHNTTRKEVSSRQMRSAPRSCQAPVRSQARPPLLLRPVHRRMSGVHRRLSGVPPHPHRAVRAGQAPARVTDRPYWLRSRWGGAGAVGGTRLGQGAGPGRDRGGVCAGAGVREGRALGQRRKHRRSAAAEQVSWLVWGVRAGLGLPQRPAGGVLAPRKPLTAAGRGPFPGAGLRSLRAPVRPLRPAQGRKGERAGKRRRRRGLTGTSGMGGVRGAAPRPGPARGCVRLPAARARCW